jgi:hypothetical protein
LAHIDRLKTTMNIFNILLGLARNLAFRVERVKGSTCLDFGKKYSRTTDHKGCW